MHVICVVRKFGATAASSEMKDAGLTFLQLKLVKSRVLDDPNHPNHPFIGHQHGHAHGERADGAVAAPVLPVPGADAEGGVTVRLTVACGLVTITRGTTDGEDQRRWRASRDDGECGLRCEQWMSDQGAATCDQITCFTGCTRRSSAWCQCASFYFSGCSSGRSK
jgi:hypothetical protein